MFTHSCIRYSDFLKQLVSYANDVFFIDKISRMKTEIFKAQQSSVSEGMNVTYIKPVCDMKRIWKIRRRKLLKSKY